MFEFALDLMQRHMPSGFYAGCFALLIALFISLFIAWTLFITVCGFACWYGKTTAIAKDLKRINRNIYLLRTSVVRYKGELSKVRATRNRFAAIVGLRPTDDSHEADSTNGVAAPPMGGGENPGSA